MKHLSLFEINDLIRGNISSEKSEMLYKHIAECELCRQRHTEIITYLSPEDNLKLASNAAATVKNRKSIYKIKKSGKNKKIKIGQIWSVKSAIYIDDFKFDTNDPRMIYINDIFKDENVYGKDIEFINFFLCSDKLQYKSPYDLILSSKDTGLSYNLLIEIWNNNTVPASVLRECVLETTKKQQKKFKDAFIQYCKQPLPMEDSENRRLYELGEVNNASYFRNIYYRTMGLQTNVSEKKKSTAKDNVVLIDFKKKRELGEITAGLRLAAASSVTVARIDTRIISSNTDYELGCQIKDDGTSVRICISGYDKLNKISVIEVSKSGRKKKIKPVKDSGLIIFELGTIVRVAKYHYLISFLYKKQKYSYKITF